MFSMMISILSPKYFYVHTKRFSQVSMIFGALLLLLGCGAGLFLAPLDYQQGDAFRILYVHVPAAFLSLAIYSVMSLLAIIILIWRLKIAEILLTSSVTIGLWITALALITGSLWGKPMWGTAWIWDARLTSECILFFIYFAIFALMQSIRDKNKAARITSIVVLVGAVDLPIIHYSVYWWNTLHQGSTVLRLHPSMPPEMLYPLIATLFGFSFYLLGLWMYRARTEILVRERKSKWIAGVL